MGCPCETRTSTCRSFATISSGLYRFLAIAVLLDVKDIPQAGPLQWGWINHEIGNIVFVLNAIDAGRLDHVFVDAETKAAVRADWMAKAEAVVRKVRQRKPRSLKPGL